MKINVYSVVERNPPLGELLLRYKFDEGEIENIDFVYAEVSIPDNEYELSLLGPTEHKSLSWDDQAMDLTDLWSFTTPSRGE